jgi:hypothetical protein
MADRLRRVVCLFVFGRCVTQGYDSIDLEKVYKGVNEVYVAARLRCC